jgi:hypothetical protein
MSAKPRARPYATDYARRSKPKGSAIANGQVNYPFVILSGVRR